MKEANPIKKEGRESAFRYEKLQKLGQGTYGSVYKVFDHLKNQPQALKKIKFLACDEGIPVHALREIAILKKLNHPNIIQINDIHYQIQQNKLYLNLEYCQENLYDYLNNNHPLSPYAIKVISSQSQSYMMQIIEGIAYLHQQGVLHRDLKSNNILINSSGIIKICDFGQSKFINLLDQKHTPQISTLWYRPPEILLGSETYDCKVDMWGVGCIMMELIRGSPLFKSNSQVGQIFQILTNRGGISRKKFPNWKYLSPQYPRLPLKPLQIENCDKQAVDLLQNLLEVDPNKRIGAKQALKHPYFNGYY